MSEHIREVRPVFIVGVGRSGTSLLQSMLDAHPKITFLPETHFYRNYVSAKKKRATLEQAGVENFVELLEADQDFKRVNIEPKKLLENYLSAKEEFNLEEVYRTMLEQYLENYPETHLVGDKDPRNIDYLESLYQSFSDAKILHIVRDPRDVLSSRMKAAWSKHRPVWQHVLLYETQLKRGRKMGKKLFGANYHEFRYEDLITYPEITLQKIAAHIELEYDENMLQFSKSAERLVDKREMSWKKETLGPLLKTNKDKWKESLKPWQINMAEQVCTTAFKDFDYEYSKAHNQYGLFAGIKPLFSNLYQLRLNRE